MYNILTIQTHTHIFNPFRYEFHGTVHKINMQINDLPQKKNTTQIKKENIGCTPMFLRLIHIVTHTCSLFIFLTMWYSSICIHQNLPILLLMNIGCLQFMLMNILVHVSWTSECIDRSGIVGL